MEYKLERAMVHMQYVWRRIRKRRHKVLSPLKKEVPVMARGPQYIKGERIGKGAFGVVYLGMDVVTSEHVAVKEIEVDPANVTTVEQVRKEFEFLRQLRHPHVVGVHGFDVQSDRAVIYMEYMPGGSVLSMLNSFKFRLHEGLIRRYVRQALLGLSYLHENGIVHRDIKPGNLLVTLDGTLKLSDFGTCKRITEKSSTLKHVGTPSYMSPEAIRGKAGPPSDVWALGASIVEMATGASPWSELSLNDPIALLFHIGMAQGDGHHPRIPDHLTKEGKDFLQKCFVLDPSGRPSCEQLLQHSFPTDGDDPAMEDLMEYLSHRRTSTLAVTSALSQRMSMVTFQ
jgi:serine/threonine protein kinase